MALKPHTRYYWNVTVWDGEGRPCATSETASFETAKFDPSDWSASWITDHKDKEFEPAPLFRKSFPVGKEVKDARVYVASAGYHELFINGERVGLDSFFGPVFGGDGLGLEGELFGAHLFVGGKQAYGTCVTPGMLLRRCDAVQHTVHAIGDLHGSS